MMPAIHKHELGVVVSASIIEDVRYHAAKPQPAEFVGSVYETPEIGAADDRQGLVIVRFLQQGLQVLIRGCAHNNLG
jgi:hypothetical protein